MNILVTGATGFVGKALCLALEEGGNRVIRIVRNKTKKQEVSIGDIDADTDWHDVLNNVDVIVHLAARVHVMKESAEDPISEFRKTNVEGTMNLARNAANSGVKRFVYISSIKVNGENTKDKAFSEKDHPEPKDPYGISKYEAEKELFKLSKETGMEVVCIRPPLVYGPGVKANFLSMMKWLNKGVPLPFGSIINKRSLVALDNLVDFILVCISHPAAANQVFVVADGEDLSTTELLYRVANALGKRSILIPVNKQILEFLLSLFGKRDLAQRLCDSLQVDISKAKKLLNWTPPINVNDGLYKTAQHYLRSKPL